METGKPGARPGELKTLHQLTSPFPHPPLRGLSTAHLWFQRIDRARAGGPVARALGQEGHRDTAQRQDGRRGWRPCPEAPRPQFLRGSEVPVPCSLA